MSSKHDFRTIKHSTFDPILPPKADPKRVGLVAAGNPDVIREAMGLEIYARKRKRGGRAKISGADARHRLDRRSRGKFAFGGDADDVSYARATTDKQNAAPGAHFASLDDYRRRHLGEERIPGSQRDKDWREPVKQIINRARGGSTRR